MTLCVLLVACGTGPERVTVGAVAEHTQEAKTARMAGTVEALDSHLHAAFLGEAEFEGSRYHIRLTSGKRRAPFDDMISIGTRGYVRGGTFFSAPGWCPAESTAALFFDPTAVLRTITRTKGTLRRVDQEKIRGVRTTHFQFTRAGNRPIDLWVDADDLLRRIVQQYDNQTATIEFYDYGADLSPITTPATSKSC